MAIWLQGLSDLFINLSAGWLGVVFIVPNFTREKGRRKWFLLTGDFIAATICFGIGIFLRSLI